MPASTLPTVTPLNIPNGPKLGAEIDDVDLNNLTGRNMFILSIRTIMLIPPR